MGLGCFKKKSVCLLLIAYTIASMMCGARLNNLISALNDSEEDALTVMASVEVSTPLMQTPVIKTINLNGETDHEPLTFTAKIVSKEENAPVKGKILIYHTHTYEAYKQEKESPYKETEKWRTKDKDFNVVRVGKELAACLKAKGYEVVHDTTAFEPPNLSESYTRSLDMLEKRLDKGERYDLYIDLHRDAYSNSMENNITVKNGDRDLAKLMVLIGKGTGQSYTVKPDWEKNYALAERITKDLNSQIEGLGRKISLKTGRFNQHIAPSCILVEAGNNYNSLDEVLASMPYLADAIHSTLSNE